MCCVIAVWTRTRPFDWPILATPAPAAQENDWEDTYCLLRPLIRPLRWR
jgi:hypothetical protein